MENPSTLRDEAGYYKPENRKTFDEACCRWFPTLKPEELRKGELGNAFSAAQFVNFLDDLGVITPPQWSTIRQKIAGVLGDIYV